MALAPNARLGPYEILTLVGAGGMGEVYRAKDTRLDRIVAIKVLPPQLASDPEFRERFEREARILSQLDHPHICPVYDVGETPNPESQIPNPAPIHFLVLQYLEGETLAERLARAALPMTDALTIAIQIASALDTAHRASVVHRDLKPGNIVLTKTGAARQGAPHAKLLDFGLAKAGGAGRVLGPAVVPGPQDPAYVPTATPSAMPTKPRDLTAQGTILGTFQYMAPEQLEGHDADARTDIFAFGALVYEMVTGKKAFQGQTQISLIGAILKDEPPPISTLQPVAPAALDWVVRRCLAKDPDARWQSARDLHSQLEWIAQGGSQIATTMPVVDRRSNQERWAWAAAATILGVAALSLAVLYFGRTPPSPSTIRFDLSPPPETTFATAGGNTLQPPSPDGRRIALTLGAGGQNVLAVRSLDTLQVQMLAGTEGALAPFWSPDSRLLGFFAQGKLKKIDVTGGPPQTIADAGTAANGGTWNGDGTIVFASGATGGLYRVAAIGGAATPATTLDAAQKEQWHRWPSFLPDGRNFLYVAGPPTTVYVGSLDSKDRVRVIASDSKAIYANGYLLFSRQNTLLAQPFDAVVLKTAGDPFPIAENVGANANNAGSVFSASPAGILTYRPGAGAIFAQLARFDRNGRQLGDLGPPGDYRGIELSPDGSRIGAHIHVDPGGGDIWVLDAERGTNSRFTFDVNRHYTRPVWSPDGSRVAYSTTAGKFGIFQKMSSGAGQDEFLTENDGPNTGPTSWSRDGRFILYVRTNDAKTGRDIWALPLFGDRKPFPVLRSEFDEDNASPSPDGRWIVYQSNESGRFEIYVQPFPLSGGKWQISTGGGGQPRWRQDGHELYYLGPDLKLMAVDVRAEGGTFKASVPKPLFDSRAALNGGLANIFTPYDVAQNGQRFLVATATREAEVAPVTVVVNWTAGLKK